jgi:hypothetical protein
MTPPGRFKNVFILSSGRTATTAMAKACSHIPGYSADHESRSRLPFAERLNYPEWHIEADNRLLFFLMQLEDTYGDDALYVYLDRSAEEVAESYARRWHLNVSIVRAFTHGIQMIPRVTRDGIRKQCHEFVSYSTDSFGRFLERRQHVVHLDTTRLSEEFSKLCELLEVKTPPEALQELEKRHNSNYKQTPMVRLKTWVRVNFP